MIPRILKISTILIFLVIFSGLLCSCNPSANTLDPLTIPKFVNQLAIPPVYEPFSLNICGQEKDLYVINVSQFKQQILPPGYPETTVWGYGGLVKNPDTGAVEYSRSSPGPTFEAKQGTPVVVDWVNSLYGQHLYAVDPTLHWANPNNMPMHDLMPPFPSFPPGFPEAQTPVPIVTHLHGGEVPSVYDGNPNAWYTVDGKKGSAYATSVYEYPNKQAPTTLWYHDHALGITRINVYAGLAGFYLLRNPSDELAGILPSGQYEIPLAIQDRSFYKDGSFQFNNVGDNPDIHPYWGPEFFGNTIMVNGKVWPNLNVERRQYRFRVLNGSNARFYNLKFDNGMSFIQIGSDGGYLLKPVTMDSLLLAPGERADILVDFSQVKPGTKIIMQNDAKAPYPDGDPVDPKTTGQIMRFTVMDTVQTMPSMLPSITNSIPLLRPDSPSRILTLVEVMGPNGPTEVLLNGQKWSAAISETPRVGSTEVWEIVNLTADTHPIHLHLVQFQVLNRQNLDTQNYEIDWLKLNGAPPLSHPTLSLPIEGYLTGEAIRPDLNETGWKDTVKMNPGQVTRIIIRFAPQNAPVNATKPGVNMFSFDPTLGPGYVWHCHILDHEDNEMMRPYTLTD